MHSDKKNGTDGDFERVAAAFVKARLNCSALMTYPGAKPTTLAGAYAIQDFGIKQWPSDIAGWKVGGIDQQNAELLHVNRLVGPIFTEKLWSSKNAPDSVGVFEEGFAAIEGEIVAILKDNAPIDKFEWTTEEALTLVESLRAGAEIASSPYPFINDEGPLVTISDFGNNFGLIIGDEIPKWRDGRLEDWSCQTFIDSELVGENAPTNRNGGPIESLRFLFENSARRNMPLKKGMAVCTGAITGVHQIGVGQNTCIHFKGARPIEFRVARSIPVGDPNGYSYVAARKF